MTSFSEAAKRVVRRLIRWAAIESSGDDGGDFPVQQVAYLGRSGSSTAWFPYGFHAVAESGDLGLLLATSGLSDSRAHIPGSPQKRPKVKPGEVVMYHPKTKSWVYFLNDGTVEVIAKGNLRMKVTGQASVEAASIVGTAASSVALTAPSIALTGDVTVTGNVVVTGNIDQDGSLLGFRGSTPVAKAVINGTKTGGTAQNQLLQALHDLGLIDDQT